MSDYCYLVNVQSGLAIDVLPETAPGVSPIVQSAVNWEHSGDDEDEGANRLWRCGPVLRDGPTGGNWLANKSGLVFGHRSDLSAAHSPDRPLFALEHEVADAARPRTSRYQLAEFFNHRGIFGAYLIWDDRDCILGVQDRSCEPGAPIVQCTVDFDGPHPDTSQAWYPVPERPADEISRRGLPWERHPAPRLVVNAA